MADTLVVSLVQGQVAWHDPARNLATFEQHLQALSRPDIVVLPETFASGFTQHPEQCSETMTGEAVSWMTRMAQQLDTAICGSLAVAEAGAFYNRFLFVTAGGVLAQYDKKHLFTLAGEHHRYQPGQERVVFEYRGWRICPQVCYDLRFPVFSRCRNDYDLLIYVANWPSPRRTAWSRLLKARAIENQCYVAAVNRVGRDGNGWEYAGESVLLDFMGDELVGLGDREATDTGTITLDRLRDFRKKFAFWQDADAFELVEPGTPEQRAAS
ncbi:MAG: amidohydrolase [Xanthomonadales bacterium]|nr:amidohydrolase [Xanthomonadales bacterium]